MKIISSPQNAFIKALSLLSEKSKHRLKSGLFLIEGKREIELALKGNYSIETVLYLEDFFLEKDLLKFTQKQTELIQVSSEVYKKLAYRETTEGIIAVAQAKKLQLVDLKLSKNPLILVAEAPEKPGNIGALLRTADAANIDAVIIANPKGDLYNPNIIRASVGSLFTTQIATGTTTAVINFLKQQQVNIYSATLQNSNGYHTQIFTTPTAIVVGAEDIGLSEDWRLAAHQNINIPMQGQIDSMNVSVAAAIVLFEAKRQRGF
jgi:RNA methyltransferase, TrmH family